MKYWIIVSYYGGSSHAVEFDTKEEALSAAVEYSNEESCCMILEGKEIKFKVVRTGVEVEE